MSYITGKHVEGLLALILLTALGFVLINYFIVDLVFWKYLLIEFIIIGLDKLFKHICKGLKI